MLHEKIVPALCHLARSSAMELFLGNSKVLALPKQKSSTTQRSKASMALTKLERRNLGVAKDAVSRCRVLKVDVDSDSGFTA